MNTPSVSVITPCYNAEPHVAQALQSVREQSFPDWEHVVVDDGSTDRSAAIVAALAEGDARLKLIKQPNGGITRARNAGFDHASPHSRYLLFFDADDRLEPDMLSTLVAHLDAHPDAAVAYCDFGVIDAAGEPVAERRIWTDRYVPAPFGLRRLPDHATETPFLSLFGSFCGGMLPSNAVLRRSHYERVCGWDEVFGQPSEDTDLFLRLALEAQVHFVPQTLVRYRRHAAQATQTARARERAHVQERRLLQKWRAMPQADGRRARLIRQALRFRAGRMVPLFYARFARESLRDRRFGDAAVGALRATRRYLEYVAAYRRL
jgi:glycosyltransferase involved in cell wall biosynthesis